MKKVITLLCFIFVLAGCSANYQTMKLGSIDPNNRSMSVPGAGDGLFEIKSALMKDGWTVKVGDFNLTEAQAAANGVNTTSRVQYDTAYRMYLSSTSDDKGITRFNLSVVENKTNQEVLNMVGNRQNYIRYAPDDIAKNLVNQLNELTGLSGSISGSTISGSTLTLTPTVSD